MKGANCIAGKQKIPMASSVRWDQKNVVRCAAVLSLQIHYPLVSSYRHRGSKPLKGKVTECLTNGKLKSPALDAGLFTRVCYCLGRFNHS